MDKERPLKILMVTSSYPRTDSDTAAIFLRHLAENLSSLGVEVHVLAPQDTEQRTGGDGAITIHRFRYFFGPLQKLAYGAGIVPNLKEHTWQWILVPFFLTSMGIAVLRLALKERPHIIHAHWIVPQGVFAVLLGRFCKSKTVLTAHGTDMYAFTGKLMGALKRFIVRTCDAWTANSRYTASLLEVSNGDRQALIIPMGVNTHAFDSAVWKGREGEFTILYVGRLIDQKGVLDLIVAFSRLQSKTSIRAALWIVGSGPLEPEIKKLVFELGLSGQVRIWGSIPNGQLRDFYSASDLLVLPSRNTEGQGVVILEAFVARTCVLATNVGGIPELIEHQHNGFLVEPGNPDALAYAMEKLMHDKSLRERLADNAYDKVADYDWLNVAKKFKQLYVSLLTDKVITDTC